LLTVLDLDLRRLIGRLNAYSKRALEGAAGLAVTRGHYEVSIEHVLHVFVEDSQHDVQSALRHFEIDPAVMRKGLQSVLESMKTGNQGRPVFSPLLVELISDAWLVSSVELDLDQVRSGSLLATIFAQPNRYGDDRWLQYMEDITFAGFKKDFSDIIGNSEETTAGLTAAPGGDDKAPSSRAWNEPRQRARPLLHELHTGSPRGQDRSGVLPGSRDPADDRRSWPPPEKQPDLCR
jgi:type VI secretion system protein VasG